jgi:Kef-type K+ transport system membrane component KefB
MIISLVCRGLSAVASISSEGGILSGVPALHDPIARFFMQAVVIIVTCRALTVFTFALQQPMVVFEILGGIILGPSALGRDKEYLNKIFPPESLNNINLVANIGLVLYLFLVGLDLDAELLKSHVKKAGSISFFGIVVPFALGIAISRVVFDVLQGNDPEFKHVSFTSFFVFMGTAMSITAFPVLARLLKEGGLVYTRPGALAMGAAAFDDATAWCLLVLSISIANAKNMSIAGLVFLCVVAYALGLFFLVRPVLIRLVRWVEEKRRPALNGHLFAFTICLVFLSAWTTCELTD